MEEIRTLTKDELDESIALSCFAFQYELTGEEREARKRRMNPDDIWGYFVDGKLAAKMTVHPMRTYVQGKEFRMGGVAGVATWPEYRRGGMVGKLLRKGLAVMKERGQSVSFLHPFSFPFYRKYGWETYTEYKKYELDTAQLPDFAHREGRMERADRDWALLNRVYDEFARRYNGMLVRDEAWWTHTVFKQKGGQAAVYRDAEGEPRGYLLYTVKNRLMQIGELVFLNESARRGLWTFIRNHDSMCDKVTLTAPCDDRLPFLLPDPRIRQETVPYFMARIVDVERFIEQYPFEPAGGETVLLIRVRDGEAAWNDGFFRIRVGAEGRAAVTKASADAFQEGPRPIACDVQSLTAMLMGYQRPEFLRSIGRLEGDLDAVEMLERLIPRRPTYLADYF